MSRDTEGAFKLEIPEQESETGKSSGKADIVSECPVPAYMPAKLLAFAAIKFAKTTDSLNPQNNEAPAPTPDAPESKEELSMESALERLKTAVLKIDFDDTVKRMEKVFPVDAQKCKQLRRRIRLSSSVAETIALNEEFMTNLNDYLDVNYSGRDLARLRIYINKVRDSADLEKLQDMVYWMVAESVQLKLGTTYGYRDKSDFAQRISKMKSDIEKDLPAFNKQNGENFNRSAKRTSSNYLQSRFPDYGAAAEHVVAVGLNSVTNLLNVLGFYNYKHQTGYQNGKINSAPLMNLAFSAEAFGDDGWKNGFSAAIDSIDKLGSELNKTVHEWINKYKLLVNRTQTIDDVINDHEEMVKDLIKKLETFRDLIGAEFAGAIAMLKKIGDADTIIGWNTDEWFDEYLKKIKREMSSVLIKLYEEASGRFICNRSQTDFLGQGKDFIQEYSHAGTYFVKCDNLHLNQLKYIRLLLRGMSPTTGCNKDDFHSNPEIFTQYRFWFESSILDNIAKELDVRRDLENTGREYLDKLLIEGDSDIYRGADDPPHVMAPPSASGHRTIRVEVANGCNHSACTFCEMRDRPGKKKFSAITPAEFKTQIGLIKEAYKGHDFFRKDRIFLGNGNAFALEADQLVEMINMLRTDEYFKEIYGKKNRIECYARTRDVQSYSDDDLKRLRKAGLSLVYIGLESGSDEVLKLVNKGQTRKEFITAVQRLRAAGIDASVMVMPGLGGKKHSGAHTKETAEVLAEALARFAVFLPLDCPPDRKYARDIASDPENEDLSAAEIQQQVTAIRDEYRRLAEMNPDIHNVSQVRIAAHASDITPVAGTQPEVFDLKIKDSRPVSRFLG